VSTTQLFYNLSGALDFKAGDELILSKLNHEANTAAWLQAAERLGMTVKWWSSSSQFNPVCDIDELKTLLSEKTKLVTFPHVSNITGTITKVREVSDIVHRYPNVAPLVSSFFLSFFLLFAPFVYSFYHL
jgi:selenocysteine lyase/cysteine desulfurase